MKKLLCFIATFSLLINTLLAPISVLAETVDESPTPTPVEATIEPSTTPEETTSPEPTEIATPTPEATLAPVDVVSPEPVIETSQPIETQAPESTPTVQGPPEASATPTITSETSEENTQLSAIILENEKVDESVLSDFDLEYTEDGSASISTDKLDYSPTDTAVISGTGFIAEKTYTINITSSDEPAVYFEDTLTANDEGEILYSYTLDGIYRPNYQVKILDGDRVVAETTFTDGGSISGIVFDDINNNTVRDYHYWWIFKIWDEPGIENVTINLDKNLDGTIDRITTTNNNGEYTFDSLSSGNYRVRQSVPSGYIQTTSNPSDKYIGWGWWVYDNTDFGNYTQPDTTPPVLSLPINVTMEATSSSGTVFSYTATANDAIDGSRTVDCTPSSGSVFPIGTTTINCSASDTHGNTATGSFTVTVQDTTAPSTPTLVYPSDGAFVQSSGLILDWSDSTDPSLPVTYYYQSAYSAAVGPKNAFISSIYKSNALNISQINASGSQDNTYYWQVQACDSQSNCSDWSGPWEVTIDGTSPVLSSKTTFNGWYNTNQISEFVYTDNLSSSLSGTPVTCVINTEGTDQTCSVSPNVCDEAGNCNTTTVASNPANIDKTNPVVNIVTPGDGNYVKGSSVSLVGNIIENNLLRYYYQIKQISTGNIITSNPVYASSLNNSTFYTWDTTGVNDGEYLIQLAARDLATNRGIESEDNITVYVDNTPPSAPTLLGDSVIYMKPGNVTRSWQASSSDDVEKYIYKSFTSELYAEDPDSSPGWSPSPTISVPGQLTYSRTDPTGSSERTFWWRVAAVDMAGNKTWSNEIYKVIVDKTAPTGDWINPTNDSTVSGIVTLNFVAQDNLSGVKDVVYKYKAVEETGFRTDGNISGNSWDTTGLTLGDYIVRAEVTDKAGNVSEFDITVGVAAVISSQNAIGVTGGNIVVTWTTDRPTTSRVVYDTVSHPDLGTGDNYGYAFSTIEDTNKVTSHSVTITGLGTGVTYYYRVISHGSPTAIGGEGYAITLTNAGPPEVSGGTTGVLGTTTGGLLAGAFPQLAIMSGNEEDVENETVETGSGNTSPEPEVLGAETEASEGIGEWIKTHMGLSLGIATLIGLIIFFIIKKSKKKNE